MSLTDSPAQRSLNLQDVPEQGLTIAEAARYSGVTAHTLRYYERTGMVPAPPGRTSGGRRRYHAADLKWIRMCTMMRATGMPIRLIRRYADLLRAGPGNEQQRLGLLEAHREQVLAQLASVTENLALIDHKIDVYRQRIADGTLDEICPMPPDS